MQIEKLKEAIEILKEGQQGYRYNRDELDGETTIALQTLLSFCELAVRVDEVMPKVKKKFDLISEAGNEDFDIGYNQAHDEILGWLVERVSVVRKEIEKENDAMQKDMVDWKDATPEMRSNARSYIRGMKKAQSIHDHILGKDSK